MSSLGSCAGSPCSDIFCDTNASPVPTVDVAHQNLLLRSSNSSSSTSPSVTPSSEQDEQSSRSTSYSPSTQQQQPQPQQQRNEQMADMLEPFWNTRLTSHAHSYFACPSPREQDCGGLVAKSGRIMPALEAEAALHFADMIPADRRCLPTPPPISSDMPHLSRSSLVRSLESHYFPFSPSHHYHYYQHHPGKIHRAQHMPFFSRVIDQYAQEDGVDVNVADETLSGGLFAAGLLSKSNRLAESQNLEEMKCPFLHCQASGDPLQASPMATPPSARPRDDFGSAWSGGLAAPSNLAEKRLGVRFNLSMGPRDASIGGGDLVAAAAPALGTSQVPDLLQDCEDEDESWLDTAVQVVKSILDSQGPRASLKVLSHALPLPSVPGHSFPSVIEKAKSQLPSDEIIWTSLLHAVPGQFKLEDLPKSPLTTPGQPVNGEDYFATKVFESAVTSVDYSEGITLSSPKSHPLAAPGSVDMAIVERHIPPPTSDELETLYSTTGRSILVDRMIEISPQNGCLLFIYPTRKGGQKFASEYLGPVLDPLLRSIAVLNNFSSSLSSSLGRMASIDSLLEFENMRENIARLCEAMSKDGRDTKRMLHGIDGSFHLMYADKKEVYLERAVWSDWWTKQEKGRIRKVATDYFSTSSNHAMMPHTLIREIMDGVSFRPTQEVPVEKIELGVFVIQRTAR